MSPTPTAYSPSWEKFLIWLLSKQGTLSAATIHFKDTWKSTHITLWPYTTANLFDVTLPCIEKTSTRKPVVVRRRNTYFSSMPRIMSAAVFQVKLKANTKQLINLDLPTQRSFVCVVSHVCHWWNAVTGNICWGKKCCEMLLNYRCRPKAIHQNCCSYCSVLACRILCCLVSPFFHKHKRFPWIEQVSWSLSSPM